MSKNRYLSRKRYHNSIKEKKHLKTNALILTSKAEKIPEKNQKTKKKALYRAFKAQKKVHET